jgi:RNA polymerase sigma-70 factor (ECF subfamily)
VILSDDSAQRAVKLSETRRVWLEREYPRHQHDIEDAPQIALLKLLECGKGGDAEIGNMLAWLYIVARNALLDIIRKRIRSPETAWSPAAERVADSGKTPEEIVDWHQHVALVVRAAIRLPKRLRTILWLSKREGLTYRKIAEQMQVTEKQVKRDIARALYSIRRKVGRKM